jgi:hypothetical protein
VGNAWAFTKRISTIPITGILVSAALLAGAGQATAFGNGDVQTQPSGDVVTIRNVVTRTVVDNGGHLAHADGVYLNRNVEDASSQDWELRWAEHSDGMDWYQIISRNSGQCLDVEGSETADGTRVLQYQCTGSDNQLWSLHHEVGHLAIQSKHSGKWLTPGNVAGTSGLVIYRTWDNYQHWDMPKTTYRFASNRVSVLGGIPAWDDPTRYICSNANYQFPLQDGMSTFDDSLGEIHHGQPLDVIHVLDQPSTAAADVSVHYYHPGWGEWQIGQVWLTCEPRM